MLTGCYGRAELGVNTVVFESRGLRIQNGLDPKKQLMMAAGERLVNADINIDMSNSPVKGCFDKVCILIVS